MSSTVRVNLLPVEVDRRNAARRVQAAAAGAGVGVLVLLGVVYLWQVGQVNAAKDELASQEAQVQALQAEVNDLSEFQRLADQGVLLDQVIIALLAEEISFEGVLQDLAAVFPSDAAISSLSITSNPGGTARVAGTAQSLLGHAPGLERVLIALEKVAAFENVFFGGSAMAPNGITDFSVTFDVTPLVLTGRYANGLPEALR